MAMDKLRSDFEEWFNEEMAMRVTESNATVVRLMWKAWQASRASIVVELPETDDYANNPHGHGRNQGIAECADSLRTIGLSIKGE